MYAPSGLDAFYEMLIDHLRNPVYINKLLIDSDELIFKQPLRGRNYRQRYIISLYLQRQSPAQTTLIEQIKSFIDLLIFIGFDSHIIIEAVIESTIQIDQARNNYLSMLDQMMTDDVQIQSL